LNHYWCEVYDGPVIELPNVNEGAETL